MGIWGIPISAGKLMSRGDHGIVVSFEMGHILLNRLLRAQAFSSERVPLTETIIPHLRPTDIYQYPRVPTAPTFAFAQQGNAAIVFVKTPDISYSDKTRIIFWYLRYPARATKGSDLLDIPEDGIHLLTALVSKKVFEFKGQPVPVEIEETIETESERIKRDWRGLNHWITDTFEMREEEIEQMSISAVEADFPQRGRRFKKSGKKKPWTGTKSEFCRLIRDEHQAHPEQYKSLRHAAFSLFKEYRFREDWTKEECYDLAKKV